MKRMFLSSPTSAPSKRPINPGVRKMAPAVLLALQACSTIPSSRAILPSPDTEKALERLGRRTGAVVDALTVTGEETVFRITSSGGRVLEGQPRDPNALGFSETRVAEPFDSLAMVHYTEPAETPMAERLRKPIKSSYPKPSAPGSAQRRLSCDALGVEPARAEALRWFARNGGAMKYTTQQQARRHPTNGAEYAAITALVIVVAAVGSGGDELSTMVDEQTNLQIFAAIDGVRHSMSEHACAESRLRDETRLFDGLSPQPVPEANNRHCGVLFHCAPAAASPEAAAPMP